MKCPQGMSNVNRNGCIIFNKCIYGLVQAARQYYKKAIEMLKKAGFVGGNANPCFHVKKSAKGVVYVALYVDDNFMVGNLEAIDEAIVAILKLRKGCRIIYPMR